MASLKGPHEAHGVLVFNRDNFNKLNIYFVSVSIQQLICGQVPEATGPSPLQHSPAPSGGS